MIFIDSIVNLSSCFICFIIFVDYLITNCFKNSWIMLSDISYAINSRFFLVEKISLFCEIDKFYPVCCCHCLELFWPHYLRLDWSWKIETRSPLWHINTKIAVVAAENDLLYYSSLLFYCLAIMFLSWLNALWIESNIILNLSSISIGYYGIGFCLLILRKVYRTV